MNFIPCVISLLDLTLVSLTDLWLKEGFASFMENLCVDNLFPDYNVWTQFVSDAYTAALTLDALHNSHPIEVPVGHPSEIDEIFDTISYDKGSSVIRMLYHYVGDEVTITSLSITHILLFRPSAKDSTNI